MQAVTDAATELSGAKFGAFFYNNTTDARRRFLHALHADRGAPRGFRRVRAAARDGALRADLSRRGADSLRGRPAGSPVRADAAPSRHAGRSSARPQLPGGAGDLEVRERSSAGCSSATPRRTCSASGPSGWSWVSRPRPPSRSTTPGCSRRCSRRPRSGKQLLESERFARGEAERASAMKDEFLATLSHELQDTPERDSRLVPHPSRARHERSGDEPGSGSHRAKRPHADAAHRGSSRHEPDHLGQDAARHPAGAARELRRGGHRDRAALGRGEGDHADEASGSRCRPHQRRPRAACSRWCGTSSPTPSSSPAEMDGSRSCSSA